MGFIKFLIIVMALSHLTYAHAFVDGCQYMTTNYTQADIDANEVALCVRMQNIQALRADGACLPCIYSAMQNQQDTGIDWEGITRNVAGPLALLGLGIYSQRQETKRAQGFYDMIRDQNHECTQRHSSYYQLLTDLEIGAVMTPEQAGKLNAVCNGVSYQNYAGGRGYIQSQYPGSQCYGRYTCGGYTNGFMSAMNGPYYPSAGAGWGYQANYNMGGGSSSDIMSLLALGLLGGGGGGLNLQANLGLNGGLYSSMGGGLNTSYYNPYLSNGLNGRADLYYRAGPSGLWGYNSPYSNGFNLDFNGSIGGGGRWNGGYDPYLSYQTGWGVDGRYDPRTNGSSYWNNTGSWNGDAYWQQQQQRQQQWQQQQRYQGSVWDFENRLNASTQVSQGAALDSLYENYARSYSDLNTAQQSQYHNYQYPGVGADLNFNAGWGYNFNWY